MTAIVREEGKTIPLRRSGDLSEATRRGYSPLPTSEEQSVARSYFSSSGCQFCRNVTREGLQPDLSRSPASTAPYQIFTRSAGGR